MRAAATRSGRGWRCPDAHMPDRSATSVEARHQALEHASKCLHVIVGPVLAFAADGEVFAERRQPMAWQREGAPSEVSVSR